jgi:hypothetical protein
MWLVPRCPRVSGLRGETELGRKSGSRLGPRRDDVEQQATDGHPDRERVRQLGTSFAVFVSRGVMRRMRRSAILDIGPVARISEPGIIHGLGRG